jgi:hypothetical protein
VNLVGWIAFQHLVLRDQALRAFGEEDRKRWISPTLTSGYDGRLAA